MGGAVIVCVKMGHSARILRLSVIYENPHPKAIGNRFFHKSCFPLLIIRLR